MEAKRPIEQPVSLVDIPRKRPDRTPRRVALIAGAAVAAAALTVFLARLRSAAPVVERGSIWTDTVKRGQMMRDVKGPGTLVPERMRLITAETAGRVERVPLRPGAKIEADAILVELSNPDVMLQALDAERQLAQAKADLINLRATSQGNALSTEASVATLETEEADALRRAHALEPLMKDGTISQLEAQQQLDRASELRRRSSLEKQRLQIVSSSGKEQVAAQQAQIERLKAVVQFRRRQVESMKVRSPDAGVLSELPLELGQWVTPGSLLAKVVQPDKLKAVLRIPETQARDVALGLPASVDTRNGVVRGTVARISPGANQGSVEVDVALAGELPRGARPDLNVEGTIEIENLADVLHLSRPAGTQPDTAVELFKLTAAGDEAHRVKVRLGRSSVTAVEVREGLSEGDQIVLSDMSAYEAASRVRIR